MTQFRQLAKNLITLMRLLLNHPQHLKAILKLPSPNSSHMTNLLTFLKP